MANDFSQNLRILVAKIEDIPGTAESLDDADFDVRIRNPEITPIIEPDDEGSKWARGDHGEAEVVMGAQSGTIAFNIYCVWGGAVNTEPNWFKFAKGCGQSVVAYASTGLALQPLKASDETTLTIWVYDIQRGASPSAIVYKFAGCSGNMVIGAEGIGKPWIANFTFTGKLQDVEDVATADIPVPFGLDTTSADKMLNNSMVIDNVSQKVTNFSLDVGNDVQPVFDQADDTGYSHFGIVARAPRFSCNPLLVPTTTDDVWGRITSGLTGVASTYALGIGDTGLDNKFYLTAPKAQLMTVASANREGLVNWDQTYKLLPNGVTGAVADGDLDEQVTWELLQGSRS